MRFPQKMYMVGDGSGECLSDEPVYSELPNNSHVAEYVLNKVVRVEKTTKMARKQGEKRVDYICNGCGHEVLETWVVHMDPNGGYWLREMHGPMECIRELNRRLKKILESTETN